MISFGGAAIVFFIITLCATSISVTALIAIYFLGYGLLNFTAGPAWCLPAETVAPVFVQQNMGTALLFAGMGGFVMTTVAGYVIEGSNAMLGLYCVIACQAMVFLCVAMLHKKYHI